MSAVQTSALARGVHVISVRYSGDALDWRTSKGSVSVTLA